MQELCTAHDLTLRTAYSDNLPWRAGRASKRPNDMTELHRTFSCHRAMFILRYEVLHMTMREFLGRASYFFCFKDTTDSFREQTCA